ncbi:hypothetical protein PanWU01x14_277800 [Parasponia andersonii]|uniref:Uncharacterized protein n=1 Tax=Parasponia andersonii TaxID=3476 RepID=A0A2P5B2H1_PARAD|nr:hypothetical protein PanWU01x14_277800 [Parasponia andersonii]
MHGLEASQPSISSKDPSQNTCSKISPFLRQLLWNSREFFSSNPNQNLPNIRFRLAIIPGRLPGRYFHHRTSKSPNIARRFVPIVVHSFRRHI